MRILIVSTSFEGVSNLSFSKTEKKTSEYPVGLIYLHSYLVSKGHETDVLWLNHSRDSLKEIKKSIQEFKPNVIGFQVLTATRISTYKAIEYIHENYPDIKIILGGIHATVMWKQLVDKYPYVTCVLGEGENTFDELVKELFKKNPKLCKIDGIAYNNGFESIRTKPRELLDVNTLPFPSHEIFLNDKERDDATILTTRGCPNACSFCCLNPESKRRVRFRDVNNVIEEIEYILKTFPQVKKIWIQDDSFFIDNNRVIKFCDEIIRRNIKVDFLCSGRMKPLTEEMVLKLEQAGFKTIFLGLESGSKRILDSCRKNITPEDVINAFKLFAKTKINIKAHLIIGLPNENWESIKETAKLIRQIQKIKYTIYPTYFNILQLYPGSEVYEIAKSRGFINDSYWLTNKEVPLYTSEHSLEQLKEFERYLANEVSIYTIKTRKGFFRQLPMIPYVIKYFNKKNDKINLIKNALREFK